MPFRFASISAVFAFHVPRMGAVLYVETNTRPSLYALPAMQPFVMWIDWPGPAVMSYR